MNAKLLKKVRRKARQLAAELPERRLLGKLVASTRYVKKDGTPAVMQTAINDP